MDEIQIALTIGVIAFIIVFMSVYIKIAKKVTQGVNERLTKEFTKRINMFVDSFESDRKDVYEEIYRAFMGDLISKEKDLMLKKIPELKGRYKKAVGKLVAISENNTVLFTTQEEEDEFKNRIDILERDTVISEDIIKTLPYLAEFVEVHKELVLDIFKGYLEKITTAYQYLWHGLDYADYENESNEYLRDIYKKRFEACCDVLLKNYRGLIEEIGWDVICDEFPKINNEKNHQIFINVCENDEEAYLKWTRFWCNNLQEICLKDGYGPLYSEIYNFLNQVNEEFGNPAWLKYPSQGFSLPSYSSLSNISFKDYDRKEFMRIRDLYISVILKGDYYHHKDPKYKEA